MTSHRRHYGIVRCQMPTGISILQFEGLRYQVRTIVVRPFLTITIELLKALSLVISLRQRRKLASSAHSLSIWQIVYRSWRFR